MPKAFPNLNSPLRVQRWLDSLAYNPGHSMRSLPGVQRTKKAHCLEAAMSAAALLEPHGYPPLILDLESADKLDHTVLLYKHNGKWGSVGKSRDIGLDGRKPVFKTIHALVLSYAAPYIDHKAVITGYGVLNLRTLKNQRWRTSTGNNWYVEEALRRIPHRPLKLSKQFITHWRQRYIEFKKLHPHRQPDYYSNQKYWL